MANNKVDSSVLMEILRKEIKKKGKERGSKQYEEALLECIANMIASERSHQNRPTQIAKEVEKVEKKLGNKGFVDRAPVEVVQEHQQRLVDWQQKLEHTRKSLDALGGTAA